MSQTELARQVGVRFQQIQKYESGANRISAGRLWEMAAALEVPVGYFFEGLEGAEADGADASAEVLFDKEALSFVRTYYAIPTALRRRLFDLARVLTTAA